MNQGGDTTLRVVVAWLKEFDVVRAAMHGGRGDDIGGGEQEKEGVHEHEGGEGDSPEWTVEAEELRGRPSGKSQGQCHKDLTAAALQRRRAWVGDGKGWRRVWGCSRREDSEGSTPDEEW